MFLSVIVSCFNCEKYIKRVLNSLLVQNFDDFEVIIVDDCSTDNFLEIVHNYTNLLNIKYIRTEEDSVHCPGNSRRKGLEAATGEWITFMDHDDALYPDIFPIVKNSATDEINYMYSKVQQFSQDGQFLRELDATTWLHGNFYRKSFLEEFNINFKQDLVGNEDLYFNTLVLDTLIAEDMKQLNINVPVYKWYANSDSFSNKKIENTDAGYTEKYFEDYLIAIFEPKVQSVMRYPDKLNEYSEAIERAIIQSYFYYQRALYHVTDKVIIDNMLESVKGFYDAYVQLFNGNIDKVKSQLTPKLFNEQRNVTQALSGEFIETQTIYQFLNIISNGND